LRRYAVGALVGRMVSSGHSALDAKTLATVRRAQPFPAFPADVKQSSMPFSAPVAFYIR
jgi:protein TonB